MKTHEVFGIKPQVSDLSYVDRGSLDREFRRLMERQQSHVAIRGASKAGKSWLRQKVLADPIIVQCRLGYTPVDVFRDALARLEIRLEVERTEANSFKGKASATGEAGFKLLAKVTGEVVVEGERKWEIKDKAVGKDINDLEFIASVIKASGRTLVIEDFHYLAVQQQRLVAFDLKTLWDYQTFVVVVGVWTSQNMLISLNPDLAGRIEEINVTWQPAELKEVFRKGCNRLNLRPANAVLDLLADISYESVGLLQTLALRYLDVEKRIEEAVPADGEIVIDDVAGVEHAAMHVAEQQNQLYQAFAARVCEGIRTRQRSTGIYALSMAAIMSSTDEKLVNGLSAREIYKIAHGQEPRIQFGNLKTVLARFPELQVDEGGRGLVVAYDPLAELISVVDKQLLLYRRYATVKWPWEDLVAEVARNAEAYD
ncbi:hypothetical protein ISN75_14210 [Dyella marensis]|uniref:hypothetical protein n=1 Tax=Dyella marensis TaxID=500610 RepID=UPI0031E01D5A